MDEIANIGHRNRELKDLSKEDYKQKLEEVKQRFLQEQDIMESSRKTYSYGISCYFTWMLNTGRELSAITVADVIKFKEAMEEKCLSQLTVNSYLQAVKCFYRWVEGNQYGLNIAKDVKTRRDNSKEFMKMHLTVDECQALLRDAYEGKKRNALRDYCIINLMLHTGLRTMEVCRLDIADMTYAQGRRVLNVWGKGKHGKDNLVVVTDETYIPIEKYLATRPGALPRSPLFANNGDCPSQQGTRMSPRSIQMICKQHLRNIGLDGHEYSAHSLRHTTAVQILQHGGDIRDAQRVLRHSSPVTTEIYLSSIEKEQRLLNAAEPLLDGLFNFDSQN